MSNPTEEDLAYRILQLERSLDAYRRLHAEELDELERRLVELKREVLALRRSQPTEAGAEVEHEMNVTTEVPAGKG